MSIIKSIDRSICLTLDKRYDDYVSLSLRGKNHGFLIESFIGGTGHLDVPRYDYIDINKLPPHFHNSIQYPTWWTRPNAYNAWQCHHKIFEQAIADNTERLMLFEDDSMFEHDFEYIWSRSEKFLRVNDWDMIYFGAYHKNSIKMVDYDSYIFRLDGSGGFHGVLMKRHIIKELLKFKPIGPYDWITGKYIQPKFNCYAIHPSIISQRDGYSYIEGKNLSKPDRHHT